VVFGCLFMVEPDGRLLWFRMSHVYCTNVFGSSGQMTRALLTDMTSVLSHVCISVVGDTPLYSARTLCSTDDIQNSYPPFLFFLFFTSLHFLSSSLYSLSLSKTIIPPTHPTARIALPTYLLLLLLLLPHTPQWRTETGMMMSRMTSLPGKLLGSR